MNERDKNSNRTTQQTETDDREPANFDRLCRKIASGFASMSEVEGIAEIESMIKALREGCELTDSQLQHLMLTEEAGKGLDDVAAGRVHDARAVLDEIATQRYARILAGEKTIPWSELKSALIARLASAKTQVASDNYDAHLCAKVETAREQIRRGDFVDAESVEAAFAEKRAEKRARLARDK